MYYYNVVNCNKKNTTLLHQKNKKTVYIFVFQIFKIIKIRIKHYKIKKIDVFLMHYNYAIKRKKNNI
jgi:hypothetical protein